MIINLMRQKYNLNFNLKNKYLIFMNLLKKYDNFYTY
jgi:hypothetical protein